MKIKQATKFLRFFGARAMALFPFVLVNDMELKKDKRLINHERIHHAQQKEMLLVFFYVWYGVERLIRALFMLNWKRSYRNISFEREAYANDKNEDYLKERKFFTWVKYL